MKTWPLGDDHGALRNPDGIVPSPLALLRDGEDEEDVGGIWLVDEATGDELIAIVPETGLTYDQARSILGMLQLAGLGAVSEAPPASASWTTRRRRATIWRGHWC